MPTAGRKPRPLTVRTVGAPADSGLAAFARLLLSRPARRPKLELVAKPRKKGIVSRP